MAPTQRQSAEENAFLESYKLGQFLGRGTYGHVFACRDRATGEDLACKMVLKTSIQSHEEWGNLEREVGVMRVLRKRHPSLVQMKELVQTPRAVYLVMENCRGGDLFELLHAHGKLPEASCKLVFRQLASALSLLHSSNILHRDIKPENVLLNRPAKCLYQMTSAEVADIIRGDTEGPVTAKLADFGLSTVLHPEERLRGMVGSLRYSAPEELAGEEYCSHADVWSLGIVLYAMLSGCLPFSGKDPGDRVGLRNAILGGKLKFSLRNWSMVSDEAKDLVERILQLDADKRPTAEELLHHPWLQVSEHPAHGSGGSETDSPMSVPASQRFRPWVVEPPLSDGSGAKDKDEEFHQAHSWLNVVCW